MAAPHRRGWVGALTALAAAGAAAVTASLWLARPAGGRPVAAPPEPDLSGFERPVAEKITRAREAVLAERDSAQRWGRLGSIFLAHHLIPEATVSLGEAERLDPRDFRWPYLGAITLAEAGSGELVGALRRAQALRSDYAPLEVRSGNALLDAGRSSEARPCFERALALDPSNSHALLGLGRIALAAGDVGASRAWLERAAEAHRGHREAQAMLAQVYRALGLEEAARTAARRAARQSGNTPLPDPVLDEVFEEATSAVHLAERGRRLLHDGRLDEAIETLRTARGARPEYVDVRVDLASALILRGDEREGLAELEEVERLAPGFVDTDELVEELRAERKEGEAAPRPSP